MSFLKSLFGGGGSVNPSFNRSNLRTPSFDISTKLIDGALSSSFNRTGTAPQRAFDERFPRQLGDLDTLRGTITPGFSQLRKNRLNAVRDRATQAIGNLRQNLGRRKVEGSSFGQNSLIRAEREFAQAESDVEGQAFLEELSANSQLITQEAGLMADALNRELQELGISTGFTTAMTNLLQGSANFAQQLEAQADQGAGSLVGSLVGLGASQFGFGGAFGRGGTFGRELFPRTAKA